MGTSPDAKAQPAVESPPGRKGTAAAKIRPGSAALFSDDDDFDTPPSVTLILLDSATGRVLHSQEQLGASGPVRLLFTENLAVAEFWDAAAKR